MKWHRDITLTPARAYISDDGRYSIVWDPEGWHAWAPDGLIGVFGRLREAKAACDTSNT